MFPSLKFLRFICRTHLGDLTWWLLKRWLTMCAVITVLYTLYFKLNFARQLLVRDATVRVIRSTRFYVYQFRYHRIITAFTLPYYIQLNNHDRYRLGSSSLFIIGLWFLNISKGIEFDSYVFCINLSYISVWIRLPFLSPRLNYKLHSTWSFNCPNEIVD